MALHSWTFFTSNGNVDPAPSVAVGSRREITFYARLDENSLVFVANHRFIATELAEIRLVEGEAFNVEAKAAGATGYVQYEKRAPPHPTILVSIAHVPSHFSSIFDLFVAGWRLVSVSVEVFGRPYRTAEAGERLWMPESTDHTFAGNSTFRFAARSAERRAAAQAF